MRAMNQEFTLGEVQEPPSIGLRTVLCIALTTYSVVSFCRIGVKFKKTLPILEYVDVFWIVIRRVEDNYDSMPFPSTRNEVYPNLGTLSTALPSFLPRVSEDRVRLLELPAPQHANAVH